MEQRIANVSVQSKVPTGMITQLVNGLAVGHSLQLLEDAHAQQQNGLNGHAPIVSTIAPFQQGTRFSQMRVNQSGKERVGVLWAKEAGRESGRGEELRLGGEGRQAHRWSSAGRKWSIDIGLVYTVAIKPCKQNMS